MTTRGMTGHNRGAIIGGLFALAVAADLGAWANGLAVNLFWAYLSVAIALCGHVFYLSQMYPQPGHPIVKPEPLAWALFGFLTGAGWIVQHAQGGAAGSWCLGVTALACFVIAIWSYCKFDWTFDRAHLHVAASVLLLFAFSFATRNDPAYATLSALAATFADFVSYFPSFRKARRFPHEESVTNTAIGGAKCVPALLALDVYSVATMAFLVMLIIVNGSFALYLLIRRHQLRRTVVPV